MEEKYIKGQEPEEIDIGETLEETKINESVLVAHNSNIKRQQYVGPNNENNIEIHQSDTKKGRFTITYVEPKIENNSENGKQSDRKETFITHDKEIAEDSNIKGQQNVKLKSESNSEKEQRNDTKKKTFAITPEEVTEDSNIKEQQNVKLKCENNLEERPSNTRKTFTIAHEEDKLSADDKTPTTNEFDFVDFSSITLLRGTVSELDRALRDSRKLIKTRDDEIVGLRREIEKSREQIHKEQMKWQRKSAQLEERNREIQELKRKLGNSEKANEELSERIKEFESPFSESDGVSLCCSSMKELVDLKLELAERDLFLNEIQQNNCPSGVEAIATKDEWETGEGFRETADECEQHNQLKLKFLRDAFFYFMIDFHSEEQIKAILAVLAYGDQREDVIKQAYRMRQRGKKFTVKEVSSRGLSFLHEEM